MKIYKDKNELKTEILSSFEKYIGEFKDVCEDDKDELRGTDRSAAQNLAYNVGWTGLLLKWERDEKAGMKVKTPSENFKWNELGRLNQSFYEKYANYSLARLAEILAKNVGEICAMIDKMSDEELFLPHKRRWADEATKTAVWEVYKFIRVNTVAPFGTFRAKIRAWKKAANLKESKNGIIK